MSEPYGDLERDDDSDGDIAEMRERMTAAVITVRHEIGGRHWVAFDAAGRVASLGMIEQRLSETTDEAVRRQAEEHGLLVGEDVEVDLEVS